MAKKVPPYPALSEIAKNPRLALQKPCGEHLRQARDFIRVVRGFLSLQGYLSKPILERAADGTLTVRRIYPWDAETLGEKGKTGARVAIPRQHLWIERNRIAERHRIQIRWTELALENLQEAGRAVVALAEEGERRLFLHMVELYGLFFLEESDEAASLAKQWWEEAAYDKEARAGWKALSKALSRLPPQISVIIPDDFGDVYKEQYALCKEAKKILNRRYCNPQTPYRLLQQKKGLSKNEADLGQIRKPREWAILRTAQHFNLAEETVRQELLNNPPEKSET